MHCRICGALELKIVKNSNIQSNIDTRHFMITNSDYGMTDTIYKCEKCGFLQCLDLTDVLLYYETMQDLEYERDREQRRLQADALLNMLLKTTDSQPKNKRLLDIGAGSGILVEAALKRGFQAEGIEPSEWLSSNARERGLNIHTGTLPFQEVVGRFDFITIVDVVEHVVEPLSLLRDVIPYVNDQGYVAIVTPDVKALIARIMGWRWWHFRTAHIGYFSLKTLALLCEKVGLKIICVRRPGWFFKLSYLNERLNNYVPKWLSLSNREWMERIVIPLNLRDSLMVIAQTKH